MNNLEWGRAICYSGYRQGQSPKKCIYPTYDQVKEDLYILMENGFKYIRMYDPVEHAITACQVIKDEHMPIRVMLGPGLISEVNNDKCPWNKTVYSDGELKERAAFNDRRVDELIKIANLFPDVIVAVSVGNENTPDWGENMVPEARLVEFAQRLKKETGKPVTFNEGAREWMNLSSLPQHMDMICIHSYPLWYGNTIEEALTVNKNDYEMVKKQYPDKPVLFSEAGWTTKCLPNMGMKEEEVSEEKQKRYYNEFLEWADSEKIVSFMFEAFDEPWKGGNNRNEAEKHWGIFNEDRTPKQVMRQNAQ